MVDELPEIPPINDDELRSAISSLAGSGDFLRQILIRVFSGEEMNHLLVDNEQMIRLADAVIEKWMAEFKDDGPNHFSDNQVQ